MLRPGTCLIEVLCFILDSSLRLAFLGLKFDKNLGERGLGSIVGERVGYLTLGLRALIRNISMLIE